MNEVYDMTHADEVIREVGDDVSPVLQARMGTGGNQIPLVHVVTHGAIRERIAQICADLAEWPEDDWYSVVPGLNLNVFIDMDGKRRATAFLVGDEKLENGVDIEYVGDGAVGSTVAVGINSPQPHSTTRGFGEDVQPTFGAAAGESGNNKPMVALNHIVRRLTPVECERLQGFPDGWTRIPYRGKPADECPDSPRYKALGNSFATNCCEYVLRRIVASFQLDMIPDNN